MLDITAVIGGGIGGLYLATLLQKQGRKVAVFDKERRSGGRIVGGQFSNGVHYEAGAAEIYNVPDEPEVLNLIQSLGLNLAPMTGSPTMVIDGVIYRSSEDLPETSAEAVKAFDILGKSLRNPTDYCMGGTDFDNSHPWFNMTFADVLDKFVPDELAKKYITVRIHSDAAAEMHQISGTYGFDNWLIDDPEYCTMGAIIGGNDQIIDKLTAGVKDIRYGCHITHIRQEFGKWMLYYTCDESPYTELFERVIVALPHSSLLGLGGDIDFKRIYDYYNYPGHYLRVTTLFKTPFWRDVFNENYFILDAFGGCCVYDESSRNDTGEFGVLSWLIAGDPALEMSRLADEDIIAQVLMTLPNDQFIEAHVDRWAYAVLARPGGLLHETELEKHKVAEDCYLVGDYLTDSTINGACYSASFVADLIAGS